MNAAWAGVLASCGLAVAVAAVVLWDLLRRAKQDGQNRKTYHRPGEHDTPVESLDLSTALPLKRLLQGGDLIDMSKYRVKNKPTWMTHDPLPYDSSRFIDIRNFKWDMAKTPDELQTLFQSILPAMREAAKQHGYALGVHGSMRRDFDLIAAPWIETPGSHDLLLRSMQHAACGITMAHYLPATAKPCGRLAYHFAVGMHAIVDVSIMPNAVQDPPDRSTYYPYATPEEFMKAFTEKNK